MRVIGWSLALLVTTGCTTQGDVSFEHRSSLETRARGVGLHDDGASAQVGMGGNTCEVETASGMIGADYDVAAGEEDNVQDTFGAQTIVIGQDGNGVFTIDRDQWYDGSNPSIAVDQVAAARFTGTGVAVLQGTNVTWYEGVDAVGNVDLGTQADTFTVDHNTGTAFVPTGSGVVIAGQDGTVTTTDTAADLSAWDEAANVLYVAQSGDSVVSGLEADGAVRWAVDVGGPVASIDDMGDMGAAAVMIGDETSGAIITIDGLTGEIRSDFATPSTADQIIVNKDASVLAVVLDDVVHFYSINLSAE